MAIFQAYSSIFYFFFLVFCAYLFYGYFREQNGVMQILLIVAAVYVALIIFEKDPNQFINQVLQGMFK